MALSKEEKKQLAALQAKEKEPDAPAVGRSASFSVDLGDPEQVALAGKLGLISLGDDDDDDDGKGGEDDDDDDPPARKGYFSD